ncbi:hypothetical protein [Mariniphaga sediminis]|uniref:hypothetical protein n=1 Tax=Mariniphaga sediminis TaxID=1628158 RepID=UPI0035655C06
MNDKLVIRKVLLTEEDIFRIVPFVILFFIGWGKVPDYYFLIAIGFIAVYSIAPIKRFIDRKPQIIIDKSGIHNLRTRTTYSWEYIRNVNIELRSSGTCKLAFEYKNPTVVLDLEKLKTSPEEIEDFIKTIDPNKLKDEEKELKRDLEKILKNNPDSAAISTTIKNYKQKNGWIIGVAFFVFMALAITFQVIYPYPFSFALGWSLMLVLLIYYNKNAESRLRDSEHICRLSDKQFDELLIKFSLKQKNDKKNKKLIYVAMFIITGLIFVASYFLSNL